MTLAQEILLISPLPKTPQLWREGERQRKGCGGKKRDVNMGKRDELTEGGALGEGDK